MDLTGVDGQRHLLEKEAVAPRARTDITRHRWPETDAFGRNGAASRRYWGTLGGTQDRGQGRRPCSYLGRRDISTVGPLSTETASGMPGRNPGGRIGLCRRSTEQLVQPCRTGIIRPLNRSVGNVLVTSMLSRNPNAAKRPYSSQIQLSHVMNRNVVPCFAIQSRDHHGRFQEVSV